MIFSAPFWGWIRTRLTDSLRKHGKSIFLSLKTNLPPIKIIWRLEIYFHLYLLRKHKILAQNNFSIWIYQKSQRKVLTGCLWKCHFGSLLHTGSSWVPVFQNHLSGECVQNSNIFSNVMLPLIRVSLGKNCRKVFWKVAAQVC